VKIYTFFEGQPDCFCTFSEGQRGAGVVFEGISALPNPQKLLKTGSFADLRPIRCLPRLGADGMSPPNFSQKSLIFHASNNYFDCVGGMGAVTLVKWPNNAPVTHKTKRGRCTMAKTIQVRVDDNVKDSADSLFMSLGLDTSTAIRMFLAEALKAGGIPFAMMNGENSDTAIRDAIAYRNAGGKFHSASEFKARMKSAIADLRTKLRLRGPVLSPSDARS